MILMMFIPPVSPPPNPPPNPRPPIPWNDAPNRLPNPPSNPAPKIAVPAFDAPPNAIENAMATNAAAAAVASRSTIICLSIRLNASVNTSIRDSPSSNGRNASWNVDFRIIPICMNPSCNISRRAMILSKLAWKSSNTSSVSSKFFFNMFYCTGNPFAVQCEILHRLACHTHVVRQHRGFQCGFLLRVG